MFNARLATPEDSRRVFEWRNDPVTISTSRTRSGVEWDGHQAWFPAQLEKPDTQCVIIEYEGSPMGVVWFRENRSGLFETSVNSNPDFRGRKLSVPMLREAMKFMRRQHSRPVRFSTEIKDDNIASIKMFERNGFTYVHPSPGFGTYVTLI